MELSAVGVLYVNQLLIPCIWMFSIITSQQLYQCMVDNLYFSISLGMECSGIPNLGIDSFPKDCPKYVKKLLSRSYMMDLVNPKCTQTWLKNNSVASHPYIIFLHGMSKHIFIKWSTKKNK
jgi:hypothetical protein